MGQRAALLGGLTALCAAGIPALAAAYELQADVDPLVSEIVSACSDSIMGRHAPPADAGWHTGGMTIDAQAFIGHDEDYADKEWPDVGTLSLAVSVDQFGDRDLGRCSVRIDDPQGGWLPVADFGKAEGLVGNAEQHDATLEGAWRNEANTLFVIARQLDDPSRFVFQMTEIVDAAR
jgi:hypothetical protein